LPNTLSGDLTSAFDQELRQRAQRSVLEREDSDLPVCRGEFDDQFPQRPVFGGRPSLSRKISRLFYFVSTIKLRMHNMAR
jgi:hypothetical protein